MWWWGIKTMIKMAGKFLKFLRCQEMPIFWILGRKLRQKLGQLLRKQRQLFGMGQWGILKILIFGGELTSFIILFRKMDKQSQSLVVAILWRQFLKKSI